MIEPDESTLTLNPWKAGMADATMGRPSESPWRDMGFAYQWKTELYILGYMRGARSQNPL